MGVRHLWTLRLRYSPTENMEADPIMDPIAALFLGYSVGLTLGWLSLIDGVMLAQKTGKQFTTRWDALTWTVRAPWIQEEKLVE